MAIISDLDKTETLFTVVKSIGLDEISYFDPVKYRWKTIDREAFNSYYKGTVFLAEPDPAQQKTITYEQWSKRRRKGVLTSWMPAIVLLLLTAGLIVVSMNNGRNNGLSMALFTVLTVMGTVISSILLWSEVDHHNPLLRQICRPTPKVNCNAVLNSKAASIWGISWALIGFSYFTGLLILLLAALLFKPEIFILCRCINLLALPYIGYSIAYQNFIAKQWCVLCLAIQAVLLLQFGAGMLSGLIHFVAVEKLLSMSLVIAVVMSFLTAFLVGRFMAFALKALKENDFTKRELTRFKYNPLVFNSLMRASANVITPSEGLGILLGNPNAANKIIKVCNPYCGPCAHAHKEIAELLLCNDNLQVQVIFNTTNADNDIRLPPTKHLLSLYDQQGQEKFEQALNDWYVADIKDLAVFKTKYPVERELAAPSERIQAMDDWCQKTGIQYTPSIFLNGHQLSPFYSASDLKHFLKN